MSEPTLIPNFSDDLQWRTYIAEQLGELRADMKSLVGNGQPGRVGLLEQKVASHERKLYFFSGIAVALSYVGRVILGYFGVHI